MHRCRCNHISLATACCLNIPGPQEIHAYSYVASSILDSCRFSAVRAASQGSGRKRPSCCVCMPDSYITRKMNSSFLFGKNESRCSDYDSDYDTSGMTSLKQMTHFCTSSKTSMKQTFQSRHLLDSQRIPKISVYQHLTTTTSSP